MTTSRKIAFCVLIIIMITALAVGVNAQPKVTTENAYKKVLTFGEYRVQEEIFTMVEDNFYLDMCDKYSEGKFAIYEPDELTYEDITTRKENGTVLIERLVGTSQSNGDGTILNTSDKQYNYISYKGTNVNYDDGKLFVTYCVYNPDTNYDDDIINRYDFELETIE